MVLTDPSQSLKNSDLESRERSKTVPFLKLHKASLTENRYTFCIHVVYIFCTLCVGCTNTVYMKST